MIAKKLFTPKCLHNDRDSVFQEDFKIFFNNIITGENLEKNNNYLKYQTFKKYWSLYNMSMLHFSKSKEENIKEYYEVLFGELILLLCSDKTRNELLFSCNVDIHIKLFAIYSLYSVYYTQIYDTFYQININIEALNEMNLVIKFISNSEIKRTLLLMISKLYKSEAFSIGVLTGLKTIILNKHGIPLEQKANTYKDYIELNESHKTFEQLNCHSETVNKAVLDSYNLSKKNTANSIKSIFKNKSMNKELYCNFINEFIFYKTLKKNIDSDCKLDKNVITIDKIDLNFNDKISNLDIQLNQIEPKFLDNIYHY